MEDILPSSILAVMVFITIYKNRPTFQVEIFENRSTARVSILPLLFIRNNNLDRDHF